MKYRALTGKKRLRLSMDKTGHDNSGQQSVQNQKTGSPESKEVDKLKM